MLTNQVFDEAYIYIYKWSPTSAERYRNKIYNVHTSIVERVLWVHLLLTHKIVENVR